MGRRRIGSGIGEVGSWGGVEVGIGVEVEIEGEEPGVGEVGEDDERYPG